MDRSLVRRDFGGRCRSLCETPFRQRRWRPGIVGGVSSDQGWCRSGFRLITGSSTGVPESPPLRHTPGAPQPLPSVSNQDPKDNGKGRLKPVNEVRPHWSVGEGPQGRTGVTPPRRRRRRYPFLPSPDPSGPDPTGDSDDLCGGRPGDLETRSLPPSDTTHLLLRE